MEFLTTSEAADYLRLGERKLYELVTNGAIPCTKVTGKWLFPRHELDLWVLSGMARPAGMLTAEPPPVVGGSQDELLDWSLRESGSGLGSMSEGSARGLERLQRDEVMAAAVHFHSLRPTPARQRCATRRTCMMRCWSRSYAANRASCCRRAIRSGCAAFPTCSHSAPGWRCGNRAQARRCCSTCC
jgi:excisionase family DNA binding protein